MINFWYNELNNGVELVFCLDLSRFDEVDWSNGWEDYAYRVRDANQILRKKIMSLGPVFSSWPLEKKILKEW